MKRSTRSCAHLLAALLVSAQLAACAVAPSPPSTPAVNATVPASEHGAMGVPSKGPGSWAGRSYRDGIVAVSHPLAAEAGAAMLEQGGNAIDAAAAIQFALNVVEPQYSGIGGGAFILVHLAGTGETSALDARERAPSAATSDMFRFSGVPADRRFAVASTSGISVGVPGTLLGVETALRRWGTRSLAQTLAPAIELAGNGFAVGAVLAADIEDPSARSALQPEAAAVFRPNGLPLKEGDRLAQPDLARTLRLIARDGSGVLYRGEIAEAIVAAQRRSRTPFASEGAGRMTRGDLRNYEVVLRKPVVGTYRGFAIASMPPPSSGGLTVLQALAMLERFPIADPSNGFGLMTVGTLHVTVEALRVALADRTAWMGDADFVPVPVRGLLSPEYVRTRSALIDPHRRMPTPTPGDPRRFETAGVQPVEPAVRERDEDRAHTTHFTVVDKWGNVVSFTSTIEQAWGSGIMVPGYGFLLNNELTDFNLEPTANPDPRAYDPGANDAAPDKRPRSSMAPTIVFRDGKPVAAYGSPGGATIISSVLEVTQNLIDHGLLMQSAIDAPRVAVTSPSGDIRCEGPGAFIEPKIDVDVQDGLRRLGHRGLGAPGTDACNATIGSVQGVLVNPASARLYGGADPRRDGMVIGLPRTR